MARAAEQIRKERFENPLDGEAESPGLSSRVVEGRG